MSNESYFKKHRESRSAIVDIVFIHGLTGDAYETWTTEDGQVFWPNWLQDDLPHINLYTLGYPASLFEKWAKKEMDMFERAGNVLEHMVTRGLGCRPIIFVAHSLGGILTKIILRKAISSLDEDYKKIADLTRLVIFLATPHSGASLSRVFKVLPNSSKHMELLANDSGFLQDLNENYRSFASDNSALITKTYYEKHATKRIANVVSRESADPGVPGPPPTALDKNHINICKPTDRDDITYRSILRHINKVVDKAFGERPGGAIESMGIDYSTRSNNDRRDLLEKLIDSDREHEYYYANDAQNSFARSFLKTGLFTEARNDHEALLSEVETRFVTHVYHPLICKRQDDNKIQDALQNKVIDPISKKLIGNTKFTPKAVLSALYYLTEQCHIRWDIQNGI